jgi:hypothetical protein
MSNTPCAFLQKERGDSIDSNHVATEQAPVAFVGLNRETQQMLESAQIKVFLKRYV